MAQRLNPLDASWLMLDSPDTPMHVAALLVFRLPPRAGANFVGKLAERLREGAAAAPWNWTLERRRAPVWRADAALDPDYHLRHSALPAPGGERELGVLVSRLHGRALDLRRPPWECHLIEGLHGRRFALSFKLHHALMDAASFVRLLSDALSADARQPPLAPWTRGASAGGRSKAGEQFAASLRGLVRGPDALASVLAIGRAFGRLARAGLAPAQGLHAPYRAPRSALNTHIGAQRRVATQQYDLQRLQRVAEGCDASVEEILLYLCGTALRRFFKEYNALPGAPLLAAVPGQRDGGDADSYGSIGIVSLGTQYADPRKRLAEVCESARASQAHLQALPAALAPAYTLAIAAPYIAGSLCGLGAYAPSIANLIVATLPAADQPLYCGGARLEALYPLFPLTQGVALSISCCSYAGTLSVGLAGARDTLPSLQRMAVYMGQALEDLEALLEGNADE